MIRYFLFLGIFYVTSLFSLAYTQVVKGRIVDSQTGLPAGSVLLSISEDIPEVFSNGAGNFIFRSAPAGKYMLKAITDGKEALIKEITVLAEGIDLGDITVSTIKSSSGAYEISTIDVTDLAGLESENDNFSGLLSASRDVLSNSAAFNLSAARFRLRGYFNEDNEVLINGMPMNDLDDGRVLWTAWSGLNDVFRNQFQILNLASNDYTFGGIGGATYIDLTASGQRKQDKAVYSLSNRSYQHRIMYTHSTGLMNNGWAFSFAGSYRYADQGYIEGTYMQGESYFASVDKKIGKRHLLNAVIFGAPQRRGRSAGTFQEVYDILGDNFYNPNWGYQNGKVRNSREYRINQPVVMLRHDFGISNNIKLSTTAGYQFGTFASTRLDWFEAPDPRPDYYRKLPSFTEDQAYADIITTAYQNNVNVRQIDWQSLYDANQGRFYQINDANGSTGNTISGKLAAYIVEAEHFDSEKRSLNSTLQWNINPVLAVQGGVQYLNDITHNYRKVDDLLGADFYIDYDRLALIGTPDDIVFQDFRQNDLNNPNRILKQGDKYGYNFDINQSRYNGWLQSTYSSRLIDLFGSVQFSHTSFFREGFNKNGRFPESSFGKSETHNFNNFGLKSGLTYKINGRNYIVLQGSYRTRAPFARESFLSPRVRDAVIPDLQSEKILSADVSYVLRFTGVKGRISLFYTTFKDQISNFTFYHDEYRSFVNYAMKGIDKQHAGVELGLEVKLNTAMNLIFAGTLGEYIYTSRPLATVTRDNSTEEIATNRQVFIKNYYVGGMPQTAGTIGLDYQLPRYWRLNINVNGFTDTYLEVNPDRRTLAAVDLVDPIEQESLFNSIIGQEKLKGGYTVDLGIGKSIRIASGKFLRFNLNAGNILNSKDIATNGLEQFRFDYLNKEVDRFPPRYFYAFGFNYTLTVNYTF